MSVKPSSIWAVVPAAGVGSRMGAELPKQYLRLRGKTVLEITLGKLLRLEQIKGVVVALSPQDQWFASLPIDHAKVATVIGGEDRARSVFNALEFLKDQQDNPWALVHDAARPCVRPERVNQLISAAKRTGHGGLLAVPAADTLKNVAQGRVLSTVDRANIWQAHTPQLFPLDRLKKALQSAFAQGASITDEASAMEQAGEPVQVVEDARDNIKITRPEDLPLAGFILSQQENSTD